MNIKFLERKQPLFPYEKLRLDSLKVRQALLHGPPDDKPIEKELNLATVTFDVKDLNVEEEDEVSGTAKTPMKESEGGSNRKCSLYKLKKIKRKQAFPSAFILFKQEKVAEMKLQDPDYKIKTDFCVDKWQKMTDGDKKVYRNKAASEKNRLGGEFRKDIKSKAKSDTEKKESKKLANVTHYNLKKESKKIKAERDAKCSQKYVEILGKRKEKLRYMKSKAQDMSAEVSEIKMETTITKKLIEDKESLNSSLKEKYNVLFKIHRNCKKK